jgi:hypothetical protein
MALGMTPMAHSATYFVRSDGSDSNTGTSNSGSGAWRTLGKANSMLQPGDIVRVTSLNAADTSSSTTNLINPTRAGSAGAPIIYIGSPVEPASYPIPEIRLQRSYVRVIGFRAKNGVSIASTSAANTVSGAVIEDCIVAKRASFVSALDSKIASCVMYLSASSSAKGDQPTALAIENGSFTGAAMPQRDTLRGNTIIINPINVEARAIKIRGYAKNCLLERNRIYATFDNRGVESSASLLVLYESWFNTYRDNHWVVEIVNSTLGTGRWYPMNTRSGTHGNLFERDTFDIDLDPPHFYSYTTLSQSSDPICDIDNPPAGYTCNRGTHDNSWVGCVFRSTGDVVFQDWASGATIRNCIFVNSNYAALGVTAGIENSIIEHNTFFSSAKQALNVSSAIDNCTIEGNIFYSAGNTSCSVPVEQLPETNGFEQDGNLFFSSNGGSGSAVRVSSCYSVGASSSWYTSYGHDGNSLWADPMLENVGFLTFNPAPRQGSPALDARFPGGYAGAIGLADEYPPGGIVDLRSDGATESSVLLAWSAPGDDGAVGQAVAYDLRFATQPISAATFASATPVPGLPTPGPAGALQEFSVTGLSANVSYFFALRALDEAGNWSVLSNVVNVTTAASDLVPPASVNDLQTSP